MPTRPTVPAVSTVSAVLPAASIVVGCCPEAVGAGAAMPAAAPWPRSRKFRCVHDNPPVVVSRTLTIYRDAPLGKPPRAPAAGAGIGVTYRTSGELAGAGGAAADATARRPADCRSGSTDNRAGWALALGSADRLTGGRGFRRVGAVAGGRCGRSRRSHRCCRCGRRWRCQQRPPLPTAPCRCRCRCR